MNYAHGAIFGALCGDAAGAPLEFWRYTLTEDIVQKALWMPGGGALQMGKGQVTDDGELTMSLLTALSNCGDTFDLNTIAGKYVDWYNSRPFDIGRTTTQALSYGAKLIKEGGDEALSTLAAKMIKNSYKYNYYGSANGALMRCTPIGVFGAKNLLPLDKVAEMAKQDASLTHANPVCLDCSAVYSILIYCLIIHPLDVAYAFQEATAWAKKNACREVRKWMELAQTMTDYNDCLGRIGFLKHGFVLALFHLYHKTSYEEAISHTLLKGGDTDTNACIVGGLMGCYWGMSGIPSFMLDPVLHYSYSEDNGHLRPAWLHPIKVFKRV